MKRKPLPLRLLSLEDRSVPSSVQGTVFDDANSNGVFDSGESGVPGWTVYADMNRNAILDPGESLAVTDSNGEYLIDTTSIPPLNGAYHFLALEMQVGSGGRWLNTTPTDVYIDSVNEPTAVRDFGVHFEPYASFEPDGPETLVNVTTAGEQRFDSKFDSWMGLTHTASDAAGNTVVVWHGPGAGGAPTHFARVFDSGNAAQTGEIIVASGTSLRGIPQVAMADNGRFAVTWTNQSASVPGSSSMARVYAANGTPLTSAITVAAASKTATNEASGVAIDAVGNFAVLTAYRRTNGPFLHGKTLMVQRVTAAGALNGTPIEVAGQNLVNGQSSIAMDGAGRFVVVWDEKGSLSPNPGSFDAVYAQRFTATGQTVGTQMPVVYAENQVNWQSNVSMNASGRFVVTWSSRQTFTIHTIQSRVLNFDGTSVGGTTTLASADEQLVASDIDANGNTLYAWGDRYGQVRFRRMNAAGVLEPEYIANSTTQNWQSSPGVAMTGSDRFVVAWAGNGSGDNEGIFTQRFASDPPPPPATLISINDVNVAEGHAGTTTVDFTVTLSTALLDPVSVQFLTANATAQAGSDYQSTGGTLVFAPGETSKTFSVTILGDRFGEVNEAFVVSLSNPVNGGFADSEGVGTILDDEPRMSIDDVSMSEGNSGTKNFVFTVTLSAAYDQNVFVTFRTVNGTATSTGGQADYVAQESSLIFLPGETEKTISIVVKGDTKNESNETFNVQLFNPTSNSLFTDALGVGTILNDD